MGRQLRMGWPAAPHVNAYRPGAGQVGGKGQPHPFRMFLSGALAGAAPTDVTDGQLSPAGQGLPFPG